MADLSLPRILPLLRDPHRRVRRYANLLVALEDRRRLEVRPRSGPVDLVVDPSTICQLRCPYCSVGNGSIRRPKAFLEPEEHRRFLAGIGEELFLLHYFSTGEPLLNPHLEACIGQTRDREIFSLLSTNLSMPLAEERLVALVESGLGMLSVSLDGASAATYGRYRRGGDFERVVENLKRLLAVRRRLGAIRPWIEWRFLVFEHNRHEVATARRLAAEWGVDCIEFFPGSAPDDAAPDAVRRAEALHLDPAVEGPLLDEVVRRRDTAWRRAFANPPTAWADPPVALRRRKCDWLWFGAALFPGGSLGPCCVSNDEADDFERLGAGGDFAELWRAPSFVAARRRFATGAPSGGICDRCPNPDAGDWQFRSTLQALIRNAPAWVLRLLAAEPDRYLRPVDRPLLAGELAFLEDGAFLDEAGEGLPDEELLRLGERRPHWLPSIRHWVDGTGRSSR